MDIINTKMKKKKTIEQIKLAVKIYSLFWPLYGCSYCMYKLKHIFTTCSCNSSMKDKWNISKVIWSIKTWS